MKLFTFPIRLGIKALVLPIRLLFATTWLTFRAGLKAGALPVRGGVFAGRKLGAKSLVLLAVGVAVGIVIGREIGIRSVGCGHDHGHDDDHGHVDGHGHDDVLPGQSEPTQDVTDV
jgi:hypothetical protein